MQTECYLDNSSTTAVCPTAVKYINGALENYGNPSSLHLKGMEAERELTAARKAVSGLLSCRPEEIFFTGSGTEANNTALFGAAYSRKKRGNRIVTSAIEHPSVSAVMDRLENEGFEIVRIMPDGNGNISAEAVAAAIDRKTILVSLMAVNNETGAVLPLRAARQAIDAVGAPALLHCDAVQAFGKIDCSVKRSGVDLLSASAHKINGPKGIGFLYKSAKVHIEPLILGGGQENGLRSGTESVPLIAGLRGAIEEMPSVKAFSEQMTELYSYATAKTNECGFAVINSPENGVPYILNISVPHFRSETLLHFLEGYGIYVSSGSACSKGKGSSVLRAMGLSPERVDSALRISFGRYNTKEDIDRLFDALSVAVKTLRGSK